MNVGPVTAEELRRRVEVAAEGTPYVVTPTRRGFDVTLDIVDAQWFGLLNKAGLSKVYTHHVAVREDGTYTVTDDVRTVEWVAGVPQVKGSSERMYGRVKELGVQKVWALDEHGRFGQVVDFRFSSEEGRDLVEAVAEQLGLRLRRGAAETVGLVFGVIGAVGALATIVVLVVLFLMGKF
ncbi:hypothetical protein ACFP3Q_06180 [Nocardioides sp. GCM10027113]|uniref:hypothetical protein n=1 Tax=unclassified Nocardioides TaxID=2615069 RepID=UPI0036091367